MKKFIFGSIFLGLATLGYSQSSDCGKNAIQLNGVEVIGSINQNYLDKVIGGSFSELVNTLEGQAARFKIEQSPSYDDNPIYAGRLNKTYDVRFSKLTGEILATYDRDGNIISTSEKYQDLTPPPAVRNSAFRLHPDWIVKNTAYAVYYNGKDAKKMYKLQLSKDKMKKVLKFDIDGNQIE